MSGPPHEPQPSIEQVLADALEKARRGWPPIQGWPPHLTTDDVIWHPDKARWVGRRIKKAEP